MAKPKPTADKERISEKEVQCDFCLSKTGYLYTIDANDTYQVIASCGVCKRDKVPENRVYGFKKWLWPKDSATLARELKDGK
jgi:hypothetical protein